MTDTHDDGLALGSERQKDSWVTFLPKSELSARDLLRAVISMSPLAMVLTDPNQPDLKLHQDPLLVRVSIGQLELALINLVKNASDASPEGARIIVTTSAGQEGGVDVAVISVMDKGSGMSPVVAAKATQPFFTGVCR